MTRKKLNWNADPIYPAGKGATTQRFTSSDGRDTLEIDTTPWGEGDLKINESIVAHVSDDADAGDAFRDLEAIAEDYEAEKATQETQGSKTPRPLPK